MLYATKKNYFSTETKRQIYNLLPPYGSDGQVQSLTAVHHINWLIYCIKPVQVSNGTIEQ